MHNLVNNGKLQEVENDVKKQEYQNKREFYSREKTK